MEEKNYRLVGIENSWGIVPASVYPVFADENNEYYRAFSSGDNDDKCYTFTDFIKLTQEELQNVKFFSDCMHKLEEIQPSYKLGDVVTLGLELNTGIAYVGRMDKYLEFITEYKEEIASGSAMEDLMLSDLDDQIDFIGELVSVARSQGALPRNL